MIKICILGNSHLSAVKLAWLDLVDRPRYQHIKIDFFAAAQDTISELEYADNCLIPTSPAMKNMLEFTSDGKDKVDLAEYDYFLLYGLTLGARNLFLFMQTHIPYTFKEPRGRQCVSRQLFSEIVYYSMQSYQSIALAKRLRGYTNKPIYSCLAPHPSEKIRHSDNPVWSQQRAEQDYKMMAEVLDEGIARTNSEHRFTLFRQPESTVVDSIFTPADFSVDARGFFKNFEYTYGEKDVLHMNKDYGIAVLDHTFVQMKLM